MRAVIKLELDRIGKFRYQVVSMRQDKGNQVELESSFASRTEAERMHDVCYSKWGFLDTNFYLVDWQKQEVLRKHEVFENDYTKFFTKSNA